MAASKQTHTVLGVVALGAATILNLGWLRTIVFLIVNRSRDLWMWGGMIPILGLIIFLVRAGTNELRRGQGREVAKPRFRWGRLVAGGWMAFFALKSHFAPEANALKADNAAEAAGMLFARVLMVAIGVLLMLLAFKPRKQNATSVVENTAGPTGPLTSGESNSSSSGHL